jgi:hypothetical protein
MRNWHLRPVEWQAPALAIAIPAETGDFPTRQWGKEDGALGVDGAEKAGSLVAAHSQRKMTAFESPED